MMMMMMNALQDMKENHLFVHHNHVLRVQQEHHQIVNLYALLLQFVIYLEYYQNLLENVLKVQQEHHQIVNLYTV